MYICAYQKRKIMKIKIFTHIMLKDQYLGDDEVENSINNKIGTWLANGLRKNHRIVNSTVVSTAKGDLVYQVHVAHG